MTRDAFVEITSGRHRESSARVARLAELGLRVPKRGAWRLVVQTCERGALTARWRYDLMYVERDGDFPGVMFCWLPRAFSGRRVCLSVVKPSKRRTNA